MYAFSFRNPNVIFKQFCNVSSNAGGNGFDLKILRLGLTKLSSHSKRLILDIFLDIVKYFILRLTIIESDMPGYPTGICRNNLSY